MVQLRKLSAMVAVLLSVSACVDDNYDLSDIDTTVGVSVNQLVIPINIDEITLDNIIGDDNDDVKVVNGQYAVVQDGTFQSDMVNVPAIHLATPAITPTETTIKLIDESPLRAATGSFSYDLASEGSEYRFESSLVSDFIVSIDHVGCDITIDIDIMLRGLESVVRRIKFTDVVLQMPKGLDLTKNEGGSYNRKTGELSLPARTVSGTHLKLSLEASGVNFAEAEGKYDYETSTVEVVGEMYVKRGKATVTASDIIAGAKLPTSLTLRTEYGIPDVDVTSFSGTVKYDIENAHLTDIDLTSLPDVLSQNATNLKFVNPMIYLNVTNPLQAYDMYARTGVEITAYHEKTTSVYDLDDPWFQIGPSKNDSEFNFCLSPSDPTAPDADYLPYTHVPFSELSNVLSGDGVPKHLSIELQNPNVPAQKVSNFRLGTDIGSFSGNYRFVAPLQFGAGSSIVYTDEITGWNSEDLDCLTVSDLEINLTVSTNIPVKVSLTGYPIDVDGKKINKVDIVGADIDANASGQKVTIRITGEVRRLDGIVFEARATAVAGQALSPDMTIKLTDIRPKVSGYYEKDLDI